MFRITDDELSVVNMCLRRCHREAGRQLDGGSSENCAGFAWFATRKAKAEIEVLLNRIDLYRERHPTLVTLALKKEKTDAGA